MQKQDYLKIPAHDECRKLINRLEDDIISAASQNIKLLSYIEMGYYLNSNLKLNVMIQTLLLQMKLVVHAEKIYLLNEKGENKEYDLYSLNRSGAVKRTRVKQKWLNSVSTLFPIDHANVKTNSELATVLPVRVSN